MSGETPSRWACRCTALLAGILCTVAVFCSISLPTVAQIHGIPPSVTSIQNHLPPYLPNVPPSVTSLGPLGYVGPPAFPVYPYYSGRYPGRWGNGHGHNVGHGHNNGYGSGVGYSGYVAPYYPIIDSADGYDQVSAGPYLSSAPPEQTLHIVVDTPPAKPVADPDYGDFVARSSRPEPPHENYVLPIETTVLVFRDGHRQEVTNYAVMGQNLYVFDVHRQKFALHDLDVPATVKANDDRGVEFQLPRLNPS